MGKTRAPKKSASYRLVEHVWRNTETRSWQGHNSNGLNQVMRGAVELAIRAQMDFASDDFGAFLHQFRGRYWADSERWYTLAVDVSNGSACRALETQLNRPAYILDTGARVGVGSDVMWDGQRWKVTGIEADRIRLARYSYESHRPLGRRAVMHENWRTEMKRRKATKKPAPAGTSDESGETSDA